MRLKRGRKGDEVRVGGRKGDKKGERESRRDEWYMDVALRGREYIIGVFVGRNGEVIRTGL